MKLLLFIILFLASLSHAHAENLYQWKMGLFGRSSDDTFSSSKLVGLFANLKAHHEFSESFEADIQTQANLETGSSSSLFTDEFAAKNGLTLIEGSLKWKIFNPLFLKAGAVEQSQSPLLVNGGTFPATLAAFQTKQKNWLFYLDGQAAIPTGKNLNTKSVGKEATPNLFTQKAKLGWEEKDFSLMGRITHFQYKNLTHGIAQDSRFYGNSVNGVSSGSTFQYKYEGFESGADAKIPLSNSLTWNAGGTYLINQQGPKNANKGIHAYTEFAYKAETFSLKPKFEFYKNEADASPAFYSSSEFGHNNRIGSGASIELGLPKSGLQFELKARRGDLIEPKTFQKDRFQFIQFTVEIPYANF